MALKKQALDISAVVDELLAEFMAEPAQARAGPAHRVDAMQGSAEPDWMKRLTKGKAK